MKTGLDQRVKGKQREEAGRVDKCRRRERWLEGGAKRVCAEDAPGSVLVSDVRAQSLWCLHPRVSGRACPRALDMRWVL